MKITRRQLRKIILREMMLIEIVTSLSDRASVVDGNIVIDGIEYSLTAKKGPLSARVNITDLTPVEDTLVVSGNAAGMNVRNALKPEQIQVIEDSLGQETFFVQGEKAEIHFTKVTA